MLIVIAIGLPESSRRIDRNRYIGYVVVSTLP